jgi:outer membrane receptor protein involved in Fe transport
MRKTVAALLVLAGLALGAARAGAQERFGGLNGVVTDSSGGVLPAATVTITNKETSAVRTAITGPDGTYTVPDLDPGRYTVEFELMGFSRVSFEDVNVLLGRNLKIDAQLAVGSLSEVVQVTAENTPAIDLQSTTVAHNVTAEEIERLPKGRSFQSLALTAPSVNSGEIEGGFQVNGASGAENAYTVDGVVTNSLINGKSRQDTVFEYLQEVQVKTTGIGAEYGGALGGVISAVTKSGGNTVRGEAHYYLAGSPFSAGPPKRLNLDPVDENTVRYFQDSEDEDYQNEIGGSIGGPILKDRLFYFASYSPRFRRQTRDYRFSNGTEPGSIERKQTYQQAFGKVSYSHPRFTASGSLLWTPTRSEGNLASKVGSGADFISSSLASNAINIERGFDQDQVNTSGTLDLVLSNSAFVQVRGGHFYDNYKDTGIPDIVNYTYQTPTTGVPGIPAELQGPSLTQNVPRILLTEYDKTTRSFINADYNHTFTAAGIHVLKGGIGYQHTVNDVNKAYAGGSYVYLFWGQNFVFGGQNRGTGTYGYYEVNNIGTQGKAGGDITSLYVQDQWSVNPRLSLNLGVRTEKEIIPSFRPEVQKNAIEFDFSQKIAPRVGASYDVRGDGRFKLFGSYGRYYDWTKYELSRGTYGGDVWQVFYRALDTLDLSSLSLSNMPGRDLWVVPGSFRDRRVFSWGDATDPDLKPMSQDSYSVGAEYQLGGNMVFNAHYVHNELVRTIEDIGTLDDAGNEVYIQGNPGEGVTKFQLPTGLTPVGQPNPKAKRQYDAIELSVTRRYANNYFWSAGYTWSRLYGNYAGIASSDEITPASTGFGSTTAQQSGGSVARPGSNVTRSWDIDELLYDSRGNLVYGRLATDRPHVVKLYGGYTFPFGTAVAANFYGGSGTPLSTYVYAQNGYGLFVEGRGDMGRTPVLARTDLLLSHEFNVGGTKRLRAEFNVLNVFNRKVARYAWVWLNRTTPDIRSLSSAAIDLSDTDLTQGYDYLAKLAATTDGRNPARGFRDPRYGMDDIFDTGAEGYFTLRLLF